LQKADAHCELSKHLAPSGSVPGVFAQGDPVKFQASQVPRFRYSVHWSSLAAFQLLPGRLVIPTQLRRTLDLQVSASAYSVLSTAGMQAAA